MTAAERVRAACAALGSGPAVYGLIHGDVNLTNVRFGPEGPALIDFNDCGYGYYLWDVARALLHLRELGPRGAGLREALLAGYARSLPVGAAAYAYLPAFEAMNVVDIVNWLLGLAEAPPWKAAYLRAAPALLHLILGGKQAA
jgi:Ser/Thr protein kinase RdoA (MazF antagonist)